MAHINDHLVNISSDYGINSGSCPSLRTKTSDSLDSNFVITSRFDLVSIIVSDSFESERSSSDSLDK